MSSRLFLREKMFRNVVVFEAGWQLIVIVWTQGEAKTGILDKQYWQ